MSIAQIIILVVLVILVVRAPQEAIFLFVCVGVVYLIVWNKQVTAFAVANKILIAYFYTAWLAFTLVRVDYNLGVAEEGFRHGHQGASERVECCSDEMMKVVLLAILSIVIFYLIDHPLTIVH